MCGILGINGNDKQAIERGAAAIRYRGPDAQGAYADEGFSLGSVRLAIIDIDARSNQPLWDERKKTCIVYNGEVYNYRELRRELEKEYRFATESDTEVILYGHLKYGPSFAKRLHGMFAYAVYDTEKKTITIVRDHAGIKPLYYYADDETFAFGSEMKAVTTLLAEKGKKPDVDTDSIHLYWALGYIPTPRTHLRGVSMLPRSSILTYDIASKKARIEPYETQGKNITDESELFTRIENSIIDHLVADVPVGLFFSGGTDSSIIASTLKKRGMPLETFSIRIKGRSGDEPYFNAISKHLGLSTHVYDFGQAEFDEVYEEVMGRLDTPLADNSIFPTYFVSKKAAEKVKVVLSGEGGDELFFGYQRQTVLSRLRRQSDASMTFVDSLSLSMPNIKGRNRILSDVLAAIGQPLSYYIREMSPARDFLTGASLETTKRFAKDQVTDMLYLDRDLYLEGDLLRKTDLATSYTSIEGRVPLLDPDIWVSAKNFENEFTSGSELKPLLKKMLARDLPKELVYRGKSGFGMNLAAFLPASDAFRSDFSDAQKYLVKEKIPVPTFSDPEKLLVRYPNTAFAIVALYRSLHRK